VFRAPRPALSLLAGFVLVVASACSSSATSAPAAPGSTGAPTAAASAVNANVPNSIITAALSGADAVKSFHIEIDISGSISEAVVASAEGAGSGASGNLKLDGSTIQGDVDVANEAAHLTLSLPTVPITGDIILVGGNLYYKTSMTGAKYTMMSLGDLSSLTGSLPVSIPTPGATAMASSLTDELSQLQAEMDQAGVKATLVGVEQIGGQDAYHINVSIPLDTINAEIAAASDAPPGAKIDSASLDVWIYKDGDRLAKVELKGASSLIGNLDVVLTITNYDVPVTVTAPAASDVNPAGS